MRPLVAILALWLCGCTTSLRDPQTGRTVATFASDITDGEYTAGQTHFKFAKMSNSVPTRAALLGAGKIVGTLGSDVVAVLVPGNGAAPLIGRAAIATTPHIFSSKAGD